MITTETTAPCHILPSNKEVCFASVQVREYPVILGDNPSCTSGPPLTLAWDHDLVACTSVDEWEKTHYRRSKEVIRVPASVRTEWLLDAGYSPSQVQEVVQAVREEKLRRRSSYEKSRLQDKAAIVAENMKKQLEWAVGRRGKGKLQENCSRRPEIPSVLTAMQNDQHFLELALRARIPQGTTTTQRYKRK